MKTGIIILNYNDSENTTKMIQQIKNFKTLSKIIIVDNKSTDDSVKKLKKLAKDNVILLEAKKNKGYSYGNNIGLKYLEQHTDCEYVIISNPDILVNENTILEMTQVLEKNKNISFLGPVIIERGVEIKGWKIPTYFVELLSTINFFHRYATKLQRYKEEYYKKRLTKVDVIHGAFFLARMKDFKELGYFDEGTFLYYEENIIGTKAKQKNKHIYVDTSLSVVHALSQSVDKSLNKIKKYKTIKKSMFYFEEKYQKRNILLLILLKITYYISLGIAYITFWI